jgi:alkylation response protein AidB-like acyl-CoA dehydrogenase
VKETVMVAAVDDEVAALRAVTADLLGKHCTQAHVRAAMATEDGFDRDLWSHAARTGLHGLLIAEEFGGADAGHLAMGAVMEEMGAALVGGPFLATAVLTPHVLRLCAEVSEQQAVLPRIASGDLVATVAYAEPGTGVRPACARTTAAPAPSGAWTVTGEKTYVLDAGSAEVIYVYAATPDGPGLFAVDRDAAGMTVQPLSTVDQTRRQSRIDFGDTPSRLVGAPGRITAALEEARSLVAVALLSEQAGGTRRAMQAAVDHARTRFQFGRAIGSFQAVKHLCADMLLEAESAISAARHVAAAFDANSPGAAADLALAQAYNAEAYLTVAATAIQVHGGIGFTWEHPAHLYLRRARTDAQLLASPHEHRETYLRLVQP